MRSDGITWTLGVLISLGLRCGVSTGAAEKCFALDPDFKTNCKKLDGIVEGGQCFYIVKQGRTWDQAWTACKDNGGGVLAQILTVREHDAVFEKVKANFAQYDGLSNCQACNILIAYKDANGVSNQSECETSRTSMWYSTKITETNLDSWNTIGHYFDCTDNQMEANGPRCYSLQWTDNNCNTGFRGNGWYPLCQLTNTNQHFNRSNACMDETELELVPGDTANECAYECAQRSYCRSFIRRQQ